MDLGLTQKRAAQQIGVVTLWYWEKNYRSPRVCLVPLVIRFLGYCPYLPGQSFPEWLRACRMTLGLSQEQLAKDLGVDGSTVNGWEACQHKPTKKSLSRVKKVLSEQIS